MRLVILLILGFICTIVRGQSPAVMSSDSVFIQSNTDSIPPPVITDTLLKKGPEKLHFSKTDSSATKSHPQMGITYQTDDVYNGRKNSRVVPLVTPQFSYIFKNGFQTDLNVAYDIHDPSPQVNQYTFDITYNFSPGDGNYTSSLTASRFFYSDQSASTTAEQRGSFEYDNSYDFGFIEPGLYVSWIYGDGKDFGTTFSLQHEFDSKNGKLSVTPNAGINAGTQNYYDSYYHNRKYKVGKYGKKPVYEYVVVYGDVLNAGKFQILDYEITAPVNYTAGRFTFIFIPTYSMPVNPAIIRITTSYQGTVIDTKMKKENLSNTLYSQIGCTYNF